MNLTHNVLSIGDFFGIIQVETFLRTWSTKLRFGTKRSASKYRAVSRWPAITIFHPEWKFRTRWTSLWTSRKIFCSHGIRRLATITLVRTDTTLRWVTRVQ